MKVTEVRKHLRTSPSAYLWLPSQGVGSQGVGGAFVTVYKAHVKGALDQLPDNAEVEATVKADGLYLGAAV